MNTHTFPTRTKLSALLGIALLAPALAQAHPLPYQHHDFVSGFSHPFLGLDHILAMVAVGLWAAQLGGRSRWLVPASFVSLMAVGGLLGMAGLRVPMVETGIILSVLVLGVLIAAAARLPLVASMLLVGVFAIFHGHAHGTELPLAASGYVFGLGFVLATATLHACGLALGTIARERLSLPVLRYAGAAIALAGVGLWVF